MHSQTSHGERETDSFPYTYLLEWEWPEHIETMLRRLIWARLVELTEEQDRDTVAESDHLAAKVSWMMVTSPETHPAVLDVLASIDSASFAERIAENPRSDAMTLARLAGHQNAQVRAAVAGNGNTPEEILSILIEDENVDVRYSMAENHNLSEELLQRLSEDENPYVSSRAQKTLNRVAPPVVAQLPFQRTQRTKENLRKVVMG